MTARKPVRTREFTRQDEDFIRQLAQDIGCYYYKANERTYNLNKCDSAVPEEMGVFAWVHKEDKDYFWIATRRVWVEEARSAALAKEGALGISCFPTDDKHADSVSLDMKAGYQKTVRVLSLIRQGL